MEMYEYKVDAIEAMVAEGDISRGDAPKKVASQVEAKLGELAKQGYEFYRHFAVPVKVNSGCGGSSKDKTIQVTVIVMVFRRPVR